MNKNNKTLKKLVSDFNLILKENSKRIIEKNLFVSKNRKEEYSIRHSFKNEEEIFCQSFEDLKTSKVLKLINDINIGKIFIEFLESEINYSNDFDLLIMDRPTFKNFGIIINSLDNKEVLKDKNTLLYNNFITIFKEINFCSDDSESISVSTQKNPFGFTKTRNITEIYIKEENKHFYDLTFNEIVENFVKENKIKEQNKLEMLKQENVLIEAKKEKLEKKLKELNLTEKDYEELIELSK